MGMWRKYMAENGNGVIGKEGGFPGLITHDEMAVAFKLANVLGIEEEFGNSSPLGGIVILLTNLAMYTHTLEARISFLETEKKAEKDDL